MANLEQRVAASGHRIPPQPASATPGHDPHEAVEPGTAPPWANLVRLWKPGLARRTAVVWIIWFAITFAYYGFFTWIPSLLVDQGLTISKSFGFSLLIYLAQIPGYYSAAFISERLDRKWTMGGYFIGGALSALGLALVTTNTGVLIAAIFLSLFMNGTYATVYGRAARAGAGRAATQIAATAREYRRRHGIELVTLDYLRLVRKHAGGGRSARARCGGAAWRRAAGAASAMRMGVGRRCGRSG